MSWKSKHDIVLSFTQIMIMYLFKQIEVIACNDVIILSSPQVLTS